MQSDWADQYSGGGIQASNRIGIEIAALAEQINCDMANAALAYAIGRAVAIRERFAVSSLGD